MSYPASEGCDGDYTLQRARARVIQPDMRPVWSSWWVVYSGGFIDVPSCCLSAGSLPAPTPVARYSGT